MNDLKALLVQRPIVIAIAGPNGAGKSTFYETALSRTGLLFVNADIIAAKNKIDPYSAADLAESYRKKFAAQRESFTFETVFSDPVGNKVGELLELERSGYTVVLIFIGVASPEQSATRVAMRVSQGGHDVPADKIANRYWRTLKNLELSLKELRHVFIYDNSDLLHPYRLVVEVREGLLRKIDPIPDWLRPLLP